MKKEEDRKFKSMEDLRKQFEKDRIYVTQDTDEVMTTMKKWIEDGDAVGFAPDSEEKIKS